MRPSHSAPLLAAIALVGALSLMTGMPLLQPVSASPLKEASELLNQQSDPSSDPSSNSRPKMAPVLVSNAIFRDITRRSGVSRQALQVVSVEPRTWQDGCLGLADSGTLCTQVLVPGWRVQVKADNQTWVYRSDRKGTVVKLEPPTNASQFEPIRLADNELPKPLDRGTVFRVITSGGFAGQTAQTVLLADGRLLHARMRPNGTYSPTKVYRLSPQQIQPFQTLLDHAHLEQFDRLSYPASPGSADFFTITLTSPSATVQYSDSVQNQLPEPLQRVIQGWQNIAQSN
ncbi:hypothetical protein [Myxacorys almedinensis]|uniref:Uncharacterized protein n=1 Tax=Myxacorys almedinensis A TaxID=2690445 RepID=A0A8J7YYS7_9CYAN|nr:hypothetical protein [Myxacorys almedinensis]NDJ17077.1 hypothetical protein [Myxacorys almedinensis A]